MPSIYVWLTFAVTAFAVGICVVLHYEGLRLLGYTRFGVVHGRRRMIIMILCILFLHIVEIWIFGVSYFLLLQSELFGQMNGMLTINLFDCVYYSAAVFTTLGFGDIVPLGPIRFMTGMQSVAGLTLITWSASFTFIQMMKLHSTSNDRS